MLPTTTIRYQTPPLRAPPRAPSNGPLHVVSALLLLSVLVSSPIRAQEATIQTTSTTTLELRTDNENGVEGDDEYGVIQERLSVNAGAGDVSSWARIDGDIFLNKPSAAFEQNFRVERLGVSWRLGNFTLQAGDYFQQLGRGITLNLRKLTGAGVDVSLRGARVNYLGDSHAFSAFAGLPNPANIDPVNQRFVENPQDLLAGGTYELTPIAATRIGFYGLANVPGERLNEDLADFSTTAGVFMDLPAIADWLSVYAEAAYQYRQLTGISQYGSAAYLNAEARFGDFGLLSESMLLQGFEQSGSTNAALGSRFDYNQPPTLERIDQEVLNNSDIVGTRVRTEYYIDALQLLVYANAMFRWNEPGVERSQFYQVHGFAGIEWTFPGGTGRLNLAGGARDESSNLPGALVKGALLDETRNPLKSMLHLDIDWLQPLPLAQLSLHTTSNSQFWVFEGRRYDRGSTFLGVEKAGLGGVTFEFGYDTQNQSPKLRNFFYALIGAWEIDDQLTFRATVGSQRGGIKCVAGVCREFPAFAGVRTQLVARF